MRNKKKGRKKESTIAVDSKSQSIIGSGDSSGSTAVTVAPRASFASVLKGPYNSPDLVSGTLPGLINSPFGPAYLSKRSRPIADDALMVISTGWYFTLKGYLSEGACANVPSNYNYADEIMERWYTYFRRTLENLNKHRATVLAMTDPTIFRWYYELYHDVVANTAMLLNIAKIRQYNQGLVSLTTNLTDAVISRAISYWRRLSAVRAPEFMRALAINDGTPFIDHNDRCVHIRLWKIDLRDLGTGVAYDALTTGYECLGATAAEVTKLMDNLAKGLTVLEGICDAGANQADLTAMLDLIEMSSYYDSTKNLFVQGLPPENSLPGVVDDISKFNDVYYRALVTMDTMGLGADQIICFPVVGEAELSDLIPISGLGAQGVLDFTLFGAPKFGSLGSTDGLMYDDVNTNNYMLFGTSIWLNYATELITEDASVFGKVSHLYTREDGWVAVHTTIDWGDAATIAAQVNGGSPWPWRHVYFPAQFASQLAGALELRFLDKKEADYSFYVPPFDMCLNHATMIAQIFGVPSALS